MKPFFILPVLLFAFLTAAKDDDDMDRPPCCPKKIVGGKTYMLAGKLDKMEAMQYKCSSPCLYTMAGDDEKKFCFKPGKQESKCAMNSTGMPNYSTMPGFSTSPGGSRPPRPTSGGPGQTTQGSGGSGGSSTCRCGVKKSSRIVGGTEVDPKNKYPWMVALMSSSGAQFCGGTLVASKYVVTAAHCMFYDQNAQQPVPKTEVNVRIGDHDLAATGETSIAEKTIAVTNIFNHESYAPAGGSLNNDITVLELAEEVDINTYTPACLAQTSDTDTFNGKTAQVYGWGTTSSGGQSSSKLLEVSVPVVTSTQCATSMGPMENGQICAGGEAGKDSCQGDSGGPLSYESNGQHILIGDVSYGDGCAQAGKYGVYGRISFYRTWIEGKMSSPKFCGGTANAGA